MAIGLFHGWDFWGVIKCSRSNLQPPYTIFRDSSGRFLCIRMKTFVFQEGLI